jgi:hypothetical protein
MPPVGWVDTKACHRWVYNVEMDLREIIWGCLDWIDIPQDSDQWRALVSTAMNILIL